MSKNNDNDMSSPLTSDTEYEQPVDQEEVAAEAENSSVYKLSDLPIPVYFIIVNELCERFGYYGLRAILIKYFHEALGYDEATSKAIYSYVTATIYLMPIFGGLVADSLLGKFGTIFAFSVVYICGSITLAYSSVDNVAWIAFIALGLIAMGTGGIKPCVSSFGADQLRSSHPAALSTYFSLFYFSINVGSTASILITPILRDKYSFTIAFAVPACLLVVALLIFLAGSSKYHKVPPGGSVLAIVFRIMFTACREKRRVSKSGEDVDHIIYATPGQLRQQAANRNSNININGNDDQVFDSPIDVEEAPVKRTWLDYAKLSLPYTQVEEVKMVINIIPVFLTLPIFWLLYDQQGSSWVLQAQKMDRNIFKDYTIIAEQVQALNAVFVLLCVPIFDRCLFPLLRNCGFPVRPLSRMIVGMLCAGAAFGAAGFVDIAIKDHGENVVSIFYQVPQYFLMTVAEVLISTTGLEFAYSSAPTTMKGTITALYLLTNSIGNLLGGILFSSLVMDAYKFSFMCGALVWANSLFLTLVVCNFKAMEQPEDLSDIQFKDENGVYGHLQYHNRLPVSD